MGASGRYEVTLHYAVPKGDEGATIQLSYGGGYTTAKGDKKGWGNGISTTIREAHDVPERGQENDRVERRESYVKDFKAMKMGVINLKKGRGELVLKALNIPGKIALEFRLLMLKRME